MTNQTKEIYYEFMTNQTKDSPMTGKKLLLGPVKEHFKAHLSLGIGDIVVFIACVRSPDLGHSGRYGNSIMDRKSQHGLKDQLMS